MPWRTDEQWERGEERERVGKGRRVEVNASGEFEVAQARSTVVFTTVLVAQPPNLTWPPGSRRDLGRGSQYEQCVARTKVRLKLNLRHVRHGFPV